MVRVTLFVALASALSIVGCTSDKETGKTDPAGKGGSSIDAIFLDAAPEGAQSLASVKASAKKGDEVTFKARIGGKVEPFLKERAVMIVIDPSLPSCADNKGDNCPVPWDYCCETQETITANTATVQVVDADGKVLATTLEKQKGLAPLDWITVVGEVADKNDQGLFLVNVKGIHLDKKG